MQGDLPLEMENGGARTDTVILSFTHVHTFIHSWSLLGFGFYKFVCALLPFRIFDRHEFDPVV